MIYKIGTRGSKLALVQAEYVRDSLREKYPNHDFEIEIIKTKGDMIQDRPLNKIGSKGIFVEEIERKLLSGEIQMAVHSMKDMPAFMPEKLTFTKCWKRQDRRDVLILREASSLEKLREGAVIGTGSVRRGYQLKCLRPDLQIVDIRGNVDTRIRKMNDQKLDGIILAAAGLKRLGMEGIVTQYFESDEMISAPAQGALALEVRKDDTDLIKMLDNLADDATDKEVMAEREFLKSVNGDCHMPVGAVCHKSDDGYTLTAIFGNSTCTKVERVTESGENPLEIASKAAEKVKKALAGNVILVGAGPGDERLITVGGMEAIKNADCIIYDRLIARELLDYAKNDCELIYVGKADHRHTMPQEEINSLLVKKAMEYDNVVRLKGGDVYVFGRGGEEGQTLRENGIDFSVIPGVSSCVGGLAYAGIPITHRGLSKGFRVVTAHDKNDKLSDIDFESMAKNNETCVFMMGLSMLEKIAEGLMNAGMSQDMTAAVVSNATMQNQKVCVSTLSDIAEKSREAQMVSPAIIVVGDVIKMREHLDFVNRKDESLRGKRFILPKIGEKPSELSRLIRKNGGVVDEVQVGKITGISHCWSRDELKYVNWIIFTSKNGVKYFFESLFSSNMDVRELAYTKFAVIGDKTAEILKRYGIRADFISKGNDSTHMVSELSQFIGAGEKVLYLKASGVKDRFIDAFSDKCEYNSIDIYTNEECAFDNTFYSENYYDGVIITSASCAERLWGGMPEMFRKGKTIQRVYTIGAVSSAAVRNLTDREIFEAEKADYESVLDKIMNSQMKAYKSEGR